MGLSIEDRLKHFVPASFYYPHKIAKEMQRAEPELGLLRELAPSGCTAIDVGANRGIYSYALAKVASRVEAFEPNPLMARFARRKLPTNVRVHQVALADREGRETFYVPQSVAGTDNHLIGSLKNLYPSLTNMKVDVRLATLDSFNFDAVGFIKIDVEGFELPVIEGAARTIARWRPNLVVEVLVSWHESHAVIRQICELLNYSAFIRVGAKWMDALHALDGARALVKSNNVLFTPESLGVQFAPPTSVPTGD
jgi:FkbM family methyltransferase